MTARSPTARAPTTRPRTMADISNDSPSARDAEASQARAGRPTCARWRLIYASVSLTTSPVAVKEPPPAPGAASSATIALFALGVDAVPVGALAPLLPFPPTPPPHAASAPAASVAAIAGRWLAVFQGCGRQSVARDPSSLSARAARQGCASPGCARP